jgi:hypothetical protein
MDHDGAAPACAQARAHPRRADAIPLERNDEGAVQRARCMTLETIAPMSDRPLTSLPAVAA